MQQGSCFASRVDWLGRPVVWRPPRHWWGRVGAIALAFGLAATILVAPAAFASGTLHDGALASSPSQQTVLQPLPATVDLAAGLIFFGSRLDRGQRFETGVLVRNLGTVSIAKHRFAAWYDLAFEEFRISYDGNFECEVRTNRDGYLKGHWAICDGDPIGAGEVAGIRVSARAPTTPGEYWFTSLVDLQDLNDESNEQNNTVKRVVTVE